MLSNIRRRLADYTVRQLMVRVAEEYLWWLIRSLPGFGGVWLRYLFLKICTKRLDGFCWISQGCHFVNTYNLSVGTGFAVNRNVLLDAVGGIEIGDRTGIGPNTVLIAQEHNMLTKDYVSETAHRLRPIRLGSGVWIGSNCFVIAGVTIGDRAVVGACSAVLTDVPPDGRVVGSPARSYTGAMRDLLRERRVLAESRPRAEMD
jgi:acetyltransferase-like isoleucine patch superfamily enzyme